MRTICDRSPPARAVRFLAVVAGAVLMTATCASATTIVDGFSDGTFDLNRNASSSPAYISETQGSTINPLVDVVGGIRDVTLTFVSDSGTDAVRAWVEDEGDPDGVWRLKYANQPAVISYLELEYGLAADLDADFTEGGQQAFVIGFLWNDEGASVDFKVTTDKGTPNEATGTVTHTIADDATGLLWFWFSEYDSSVDMSDVDEIYVRIDPAIGGDVRLDMISSAIPEPLTMLGVFVGLTGIGGYLWKRRMA